MGFYSGFSWDLNCDSMRYEWDIPSGNFSPSELERSTMLLMDKSTISMAIFNSNVKLPEGMNIYWQLMALKNQLIFKWTFDRVLVNDSNDQDRR